jgi:tetratricopeptide (TPR) repeat protein
LVPSADADSHTTLAHLERVLASPKFSRSEQLCRFLRFLIERHLEQRDQELKESVIGVEVFGRAPGYNPKLDPIVRTEARRLRARLTEYYSGEGKDDPLVFEVPKGGYVPVIKSLPIPIKRDFPRHWIPAAVALLTLAIALVGWARWKSPPDVPRAKTTAEVLAIYEHARELEIKPSLGGAEQSIDLFEQAIAKDPSFGPAYAGVAAGEAARSAFDRFNPSERIKMIADGWAAAQRAIQLAPQSPDALDALGMMQAREAQWTAAEMSFRYAIDLASRDPLWRNHISLFLLLPLGRIGEAIDQLRAAEAMDPDLPSTHSALSLALRAAGKFEDADLHCQKAASSDKERGACWSQTLLRQGNAEQAVRIMEETWNDHLLDPGAQALGIAYAQAGRRKDAERIAALLPRPASRAAIFAALGDRDRTFELLDKMTPMGPTRIGRDILISPNYALLKGDPRLKALRETLGLPK